MLKQKKHYFCAKIGKSTMRNFILSFILYFIIGNTFSQIQSGANQIPDYLHLLQNKRVGVIANQSSLINNTHLVDSLLSYNINITRVFAPEHGFRGNAEAGAHLTDGKDLQTGLPIISLYGKNKKPTREQLGHLDIMVFDLQGVGLRFYTYISTLGYIMEACAENNIPLIILDRPNPNGHYIDGPVLKDDFKSFVGMFPIPVVYGMTDAELAQMINNEGWLKNGVQVNLTIIKLKGYTHESSYSLPIKPSPNLPNFQSIYLYPSLCFFEGTPISVGRGTNQPFQQIGYPEYSDTSYSFIPHSISGVSKHPKFENQVCYGLDLHGIYSQINKKPRAINLSYLIKFYKSYKDKAHFFNPFFDKLAGTNLLRKQIEAGFTEKEIRKSWEKELVKFKETRSKYLLYP